MSGTRRDFVEFILAAKSAYPEARSKRNHQIAWRFRRNFLRLSNLADLVSANDLHEKVLTRLMESETPEIYAGRICGLRKAIALISDYKKRIVDVDE